MQKLDSTIFFPLALAKRAAFKKNKAVKRERHCVVNFHAIAIRFVSHDVDHFGLNRGEDGLTRPAWFSSFVHLLSNPLEMDF